MIYVRDDDVLVHSSSYDDPFARFRGVHNIIAERGFMHRPAILVTEIQDFPEAIEYISNKTFDGSMQPQFHGIRHIDYAKLDYDTIRQHLLDGQKWFADNIGVGFTKFYTPWGANAKHINDACKSVGVEMIDCTGVLEPVHIRRDLEPTYEKYDGREIFIHWWKGVNRLVDALNILKRLRSENNE